MANYLVHHRKKKERLARLEQQLRRLIALQASEEKLLKVALEIRDARIRVLRAKQNQNPERTAAQRAVFLKDSERIRELQTLTEEAVLAEYLPT